MKKSGTSGLFHSVPSGEKPMNVGTSMPQNTAVGSGSRPTRSKIEIKSSAPEDCHTLGRSTPGALK